MVAAMLLELGLTEVGDKVLAGVGDQLVVAQAEGSCDQSARWPGTRLPKAAKRALGHS